MDETRELLGGCIEALVLGYHLDEPAAQLELVCEFWGKSAGADRAFIRFRFCGVQQFERTPGTDNRLTRVGATFVASEVKGTWVVQAVHTGEIPALHVISISMGNSFGGFEFRYEDVTYDVVHLYAQANGSNDWTYFEVGSDRPVDFYNPFGCPWAKGRTDPT